MKIFNIQQLFIGRRLRFISLSFILVVFFFALPNVANAGVGVISSSNPTCHNGTNGSVTVEATNVSSVGPYVYTINDGTTSTTRDAGLANPYTIDYLLAGSYTITLTDNGVNAGSCSITLTDPGELSIDVTPVKGWTCGAGDCVGELTLNFSEGANRTITVLELSTSSNTSPLSLSALCPGTYTFTLDDNNCGTSTSESYEVIDDNAAPTGCNVPANEFLSLADYNTLVSTINLPAQSHQFSEGLLNYIFTLNGSSNLIDRTLNLNILREGSGTWDYSDVITVDTSYNGGTSYTQAFSVTGGTDAIPTTLTLNNSAVDVQVRVSVNTGTGRNFNVSDIHVSGNGVAGPDLTGCSDNPGQTITQSYSATINWLCANEFVVTRSWSVTDGCNNSGSYAQTIAVGEYPTFTGPAQTYTYDFCDPNQTITCPTFTDGCDPAPIVSYVIIDDITTDQFNAGTGSPSFTYSFPVPTQNDTVYTVQWTVTDHAGFSTSINEKVTILKRMQITLTPVAGDDDFCDGEEVQFTISVSGGTGGYAVPTFTPAPISWNSSDGNVSGLYTTNGLVWNSGSGTPIVINYTDADNLGVTGGCSTSATFNNGSGFTVHPNITTNGISRMP